MTQDPHQKTSLLLALRAVATDFIYVWLMICFLRLFVVENYRVPTGSMTPTLVGGTIAQLDIDHDGRLGYVLQTARGYEIFRNTGHDFDLSDVPRLAPALEREVRPLLKARYDNILVDKTHYWFASPQRGDIAVFKPPPIIYQRTAPVYVKRVVGLPGETVSLRHNRLSVNGALVTSPEFFMYHLYSDVCDGRLFTSQTQGPDEFLFFGDNTLNSSDGRFWGPVPRGNIRGKVFFRYWPLKVGGVVR